MHRGLSRDYVHIYTYINSPIYRSCVIADVSENGSVYCTYTLRISCIPDALSHGLGLIYVCACCQLTTAVSNCIQLNVITATSISLLRMYPLLYTSLSASSDILHFASSSLFLFHNIHVTFHQDVYTFDNERLKETRKSWRHLIK